MNSWWLRLYTVPHIKQIGLAYVVSIGIVSIAHLVTQDWKFILLSYAAFFYPASRFLTLTHQSMLKNLDFHKMSVPLNDLRKAFYYDLLIQIVFFILMGIMSFLLVAHTFWPSETLKAAYIILPTSPSVFLMLFVGFIFFLISVRSWQTLIQSKGKLTSSTRDRVVYSLLLAPVVLAILLEDGPDKKSEWNILFIVLMLSMTVSVIVTVHDFFFMFHQQRESNNFKGHAWTLGSAAVCSVAFALMCGSMVRMEINSPFYSQTSKFKMVFLYSDFLPVLEPETAKELLKIPGIDSVVVLKNADPAIYEMPVSEFLTKRDLFLYGLYLSNGKPSEENLVYMMREIDSHPQGKDWKNDYKNNFRDVRHLLVKHWPDAKSLPKDLIREEVVTKTKREVASDKAGP